MKKLITLMVNGDTHELYLDTRRTLLDVLRNELGLMGAHRGCDEGECGACTVHVDGLPMNSCLRLAVDLDGAEILTIEGLAKDGQMHPLQKAFVEKGGIQCGFCTPGFVMSALALLQDNPRPSEADVRAALSGNLCRCTGYVKIVEAVLSVREG
ncbi:MAG: (2Fe-2S)-binding protein [Anaerolineae bacterium]|nr:(2Fe-2S)-binding protein [Anaerolineae bacterium]MCQ3977124.1 (2Fe-2S)-binding protein [Anaerolineae bacterium]